MLIHFVCASASKPRFW